MSQSLEKYHEAQEVLRRHPELLDAAGRQDGFVLAQAEALLGLHFPASYRQFLLDYGTMTFAGEEVYGVVGPCVPGSGVPSAVWLTLRQRQRPEFPMNFVEIYSVGEGTLCCLAIGEDDDRSPVVDYPPIASGNKPEFRVDGFNFGSWFLRLVRQAEETWEPDEPEDV